VNQPNVVSESVTDEIDIQALMRKCWANRLVVFICLLAFTSFFVAAALVIKPVYRSTVVLIPASSDRSSMNGSLSSALGQLGGLASLAGVNMGSTDAGTVEALAVMQSRQFTDNFISAHELMPKLFPKKWDAANRKWEVGEKDQPTPAQAYKYFNERIRMVNQDKKTSLITVQVDWKDRVEAAEWANDIVRLTNLEMRSRAIEKATASIGYLEKELESTSTIETRDAINRLIEAQVKQRMIASVTQEYAFRVVDKAFVPDANDPIKPKKLLLVTTGLMIGLVAGVFIAIFFGKAARNDPAQTER